MKDRILKNPFTSIIGLFLIIGGMYMLHTDGTQIIAGTLLIGGGLVALGLKDPTPDV